MTLAFETLDLVRNFLTELFKNINVITKLPKKKNKLENISLLVVES